MASESIVRIRKVRIGNQKSIVNRAVKAIDHDVKIKSSAEFACSDASPENLRHRIPKWSGRAKTALGG